MKEVTKMRNARAELITRGLHLSAAAARITRAVKTGGEMEMIKAKEGLEFQNNLYRAAEDEFRDACQYLLEV